MEYAIIVDLQVQAIPFTKARKLIVWNAPTNTKTLSEMNDNHLKNTLLYIHNKTRQSCYCNRHFNGYSYKQWSEILLEEMSYRKIAQQLKEEEKAYEKARDQYNNTLSQYVKYHRV